MFLGGFLCVILYSKFSSFLVRILIQIDNTNNKVLETKFIQRNKKKKDGKNKVLQI